LLALGARLRSLFLDRGRAFLVMGDDAGLGLLQDDLLLDDDDLALLAGRIVLGGPGRPRSRGRGQRRFLRLLRPRLGPR